MRGFTTTWIKENAMLVVAMLVSLAVYVRFLWFGPISWDDPEMVFSNSDVHSFSLGDFFTSHYIGNYIPVTMIFHALAWKLFGAWAGGHHALNILFHLLNGWLVFTLTRRLFNSGQVAAFSAIVFLLHPLQAESVAWIGELKNVVSTSFYLASAIFYVRYLGERNKTRYLSAFILFTAACLAKPSAVVLPLSLICLDVIIRKGFQWKMLPDKIPFLMLSLVFGVINLQTQSADRFINYAHEFPYYQRAGLAGIALFKYLQHFLFPIKLSVIYPWPESSVAQLLAGYFFAGLNLFLVFWALMKSKLRLAAILLFILANLVLVLQFIPFGEALYADRYMYVPIIGLAWLMALAAEKFRVRMDIAGVLLIIYLALFTIPRTAKWKDAITLYEDVIVKYPGQFLALNSAGVESMRLGEHRKALDYFNRAAESAPKNYKSFYNRGLLFLKTNQPGEAIRSFNQALGMYEYSKAYTGRATAFYMKGDPVRAAADARRSLRLEPSNPNAFFILGNSLADRDSLDAALSAYNRSIDLQSGEADFYFRRSIVHGKKRDFPASLRDLETCTRLRPDYPEAYYWKGVARVNLGENPCQDFRIAARHNYQPAITAFKKYCQ